MSTLGCFQYLLWHHLWRLSYSTSWLSFGRRYGWRSRRTVVQRACGRLVRYRLRSVRGFWYPWSLRWAECALASCCLYCVVGVSINEEPSEAVMYVCPDNLLESSLRVLSSHAHLYERCIRSGLLPLLASVPSSSPS